MKLDVIPSGNESNGKRFLPVQKEDHDISVQVLMAFQKKSVIGWSDLYSLN